MPHKVWYKTLAENDKIPGIPLPISTIHERCVAVAVVLLPIYKEMEKEAATPKFYTATTRG